MRFIFLRAIFVLFFFMLCIATPAHAQLYRKLRAGFYLGVSDGLVASFEPGYRITDEILASVRFEEKFFFGKQTGSSGISAQYYFIKEGFRPFLGIGLSKFYTQVRDGLIYNYSSHNEEKVWGFFPRAGFESGHFSLAMEWNIIPSAKATIYPVSQASYSGHVNGSYVSVKVGAFIGGGRRKIYY